MMVDTWFGVAGEPTLGFLHVPEDGRARAGVVICPPLGHEQVISYRGLRLLAQQLAKVGIAALRFDYLGEGDASGASAAPDAGERWLASIEGAVDYLRASGVEQVSLVGLSSGALLAAEALERIPDIRGVVLWDPALSGRRFLRRQRSLHELTVGGSDGSDSVRLLSLSLHRTTAEWLEGCEITPDALGDRSALVLGRVADQGAASTTRFIRSLPSTAAYAALPGQEEFLDVESAVSRIPAPTIDVIVDWFDDLYPRTSATLNPAVTTEAEVGRAADGAAIIERISRFGSHDLFVIETLVAREEELGTVVMQPAAAEHRVGPGRLQVLAARELAAQGYRSVRFDRRVTGDSTEVVIDEPSYVLAEQWVRDADELVAGLAAGQPLALVGLCSGAWVAARISSSTAARLTVLLDINYFRTLALEPDEYAARALRAHHGEVRPERLRGRLVRAMPGWMRRAASPMQAFEDPAVLLAAATRKPGNTLALLFTPEDEANFIKLRGEDAVARLTGRGADIRVTSYPFGDHALFGEEVRAVVLRDLVALVTEAIPAAGAREAR